MSYESSKCPVNKYCGFDVVADYPDAVIERCRYCNRRVIYNVVGGRIDNQKYLRDHVRDFCQPYGATDSVYREVYGSETLKALEKEAAEKASRAAYNKTEAIKDARKDLKIYKRLSDKGYTFEEIQKQRYAAQQKALKSL